VSLGKRSQSTSGGDDRCSLGRVHALLQRTASREHGFTQPMVAGAARPTGGCGRRCLRLVILRRSKATVPAVRASLQRWVALQQERPRSARRGAVGSRVFFMSVTPTPPPTSPKPPPAPSLGQVFDWKLLLALGLLVGFGVVSC